jgi:hypothetical protein
MPMQNEKKATIGKVGMALSILPWLLIAMMIVVPMG